MKISQTVVTTISDKNIEYWTNLGYSCKCTKKIEVTADELPPNSHVKEYRKCDCCGKLYNNTHQKLERTFKAFNKDVCPECAANDESIKELKSQKSKKTSLQKYGVESPNSSDIVKKAKEQACLTKYGVSNVFKLPEIQERIKKINLEKYGVEYPMQAEECREKSIKTRLESGQIPTSLPQQKLFDLLKNFYGDDKLFLNFQVSSLVLDILLETNSNKIDIEYDGWYWHQDKRKDFRRDKFLHSQGYKTLRIRSGALLPTIQQLQEGIRFLESTDKNFYEIILKDWEELEEKNNNINKTIKDK